MNCSYRVLHTSKQILLAQMPRTRASTSDGEVVPAARDLVLGEANDVVELGFVVYQERQHVLKDMLERHRLSPYLSMLMLLSNIFR